MIGIPSSISAKSAVTMGRAMLSSDEHIQAIATTLPYRGNPTSMLEMRSNNFDACTLHRGPGRHWKVMCKVPCICCQHAELNWYSAEFQIRFFYV